MLTHYPCAAPGCTQPRRRDTKTPYCPLHRTRKNRYGDPLARSVTIRELAPYVEVVRAARRRNADSPLWPQLEAAWNVLADTVRVHLNARTPYVRKAAEVLLKAHAKAPAEKAIDSVLSVFVMHYERPTRWASDRHLTFTVARRVTHLAPNAVGSYWDAKSRPGGKKVILYRHLPPRTIELIGRWMTDVFGLTGRLLAEHEAERRYRAEKAPIEARRRLVEAVADLK